MTSETTPTRILVAEDDPGRMQFASSVLAAAGHDVGVVPCAALVPRVEAERWDVVVADARRGDGLAVVASVRQADPGVAVLAVVASGAVRVRARAIRAGATECVPAQCAPEALLLAVDKCLRERRLRAELARLRGEAEQRHAFDALVARSAAMEEVVALARRVADRPTTVLLMGPDGAGKETLARAMHHASRRRDRPFVAVRCGAVPEALLESELFGHAQGALPGADAERRGLFAEADGGTLFLADVGDLSPAVQVRLLAVLQERAVRPRGAARRVPVDVRVVAATRDDLRKAVAARRFREDLYYRLCVPEIVVPALVDRPEDVLPLAEHFLTEAGARLGRALQGFTAAARRMLCAYPWPGNVRELREAVERGADLCAGARITPDDLPATLRQPSEPDFLERAVEQEWTIAELEVAYARRMLARTGGSLTRTALLLGIDRRTLHRWLHERDDADGPREVSDGAAE